MRSSQFAVKWKIGAILPHDKWQGLAVTTTELLENQKQDWFDTRMMFQRNWIILISKLVSAEIEIRKKGYICARFTENTINIGAVDESGKDRNLLRNLFKGNSKAEKQKGNL